MKYRLVKYSPGKSLRTLLLVALTGLAALGCSDDSTRIKFVTGPQGGSWYPLGGAIKNRIEGAVDGISVQVRLAACGGVRPRDPSLGRHRTRSRRFSAPLLQPPKMSGSRKTLSTWHGDHEALIYSHKICCHSVTYYDYVYYYYYYYYYTLTEVDPKQQFQQGIDTTGNDDDGD